MLYTRLKETFLTVFGKGGELYATPGSLVVLGEQADVLGGFALAAAVDRITAVMVRENGTDKARIFYMDSNELDEVSPSLPPTKAWTKSLHGVMTLLRNHGLPIKGFDAVVGGLLPNQTFFSGYSSLTTLGCLVLNDINQLGLSRFDMVKLAQEADTMTSGRPVSVIHPFVALFGQSDKLIRVNCHTLEYEYLSLPSSEVALLLLDASRQTGSLLTDKSGVAALGGQAIATLQTLFPSLSRLSDLTTEMLDGAGKHLSSDLMAACRYALIENTATQKAYGALLKSDKDGFGSALNDVQQALFDYQAEQVEEVTFLLAAARQYQLLGARAIGFGRAGCTLNVLDESAIPAFTELAATNYRQEYNRDLRIHPLKLVNGASRISF
ncbi:MAG: hypothetical protein GX619_04310 [Bacteroidales bacterium]|jgi:galactokinase|nr:hypothetical protein [Bacteroidales bacterium]